MESAKLFWLGLNIACPWPGKLTDLVDFIGGPKILWEADQQELEATGRLTPKNIKDFIDNRKKIDLWAEWGKLEKHKVKIVTIEEDNYPSNLRNIYDPPSVLYFKGELKAEDSKSVAVVGARKSSNYGLRVAEQLAGELAFNGLTVISGLARGIDTMALKGATDKGGRAIAVLGSGVDIIYPRENSNLAKKITEKGAVISEYPIGTQPRPWHFPMRNRIISGLALGVVVVEAAEQSGSLITADQALEQGKEVFAVPGSIYGEGSKGCHYLIRQGATLVRNAGDVIEELLPRELFKNYPSKPTIQITEEERQVYNLITEEPIFLDDIINKSKLGIGQVVAMLMYLELKGLVTQLPGKQYIRR